MVSIKDIAAHLGVATSTVSKGLNNATDISDDMKQKVIAAAVELGYTPKEKKSAQARQSMLKERSAFL